MVCYSDVGCFRDDGPFDYLDMLPSPPEEVGTVMMLFTRQNLEKAQFIEYNNVTSILESNYNASLDTKLVIHGFGSSCNRVWAREMRLSFLAVVRFLTILTIFDSFDTFLDTKLALHSFGSS